MDYQTQHPHSEAHASSHVEMPALSDELFGFYLPREEECSSRDEWQLFHDASIKELTSPEWWLDRDDSGESSPDSCATAHSLANSTAFHVEGSLQEQQSSRKRPRERQPASRRSSKGWRQPSKAAEGCGDSDYQQPSSNNKVKLLWRKYGQKNLKGKAWRGIVRCYYKCCVPSCNVKKLVEKPSEDLNKILSVKYESVHNHAIAEKDLEESGVFSPHYADDTYKNLLPSSYSPDCSPPDSPHTGNMSGNDSGCTLVSLEDSW